MSPVKRGPVKAAPPVRPRPVPPPRVTELLTPLVSSPATTLVIVTWRRALSSPVEEEEVAWPQGWRLPLAGDSVRIPGNRGGYVESVVFDIERKAVRVNVR